MNRFVCWDVHLTIKILVYKSVLCGKIFKKDQQLCAIHTKHYYFNTVNVDAHTAAWINVKDNIQTECGSLSK